MRIGVDLCTTESTSRFLCCAIFPLGHVYIPVNIPVNLAGSR